MFNRQTCICALALIGSQLAWSQTGLISTYAGNGNILYSGDGVPATSTSVYHPFGLALDSSGNLYIADLGNARIRRVDASSGIITTVAGSGISGYGGDGGPATAAQLSAPTDVKLDGNGNLYVCDSGNNRVRRVDAVTGIISTAAGNGAAGFGGDGGAATSASLNGPSGLAIDAAGNIYIAEAYRVRRVDATTGVITTVAGNGVAAFSGDGGPASAASLFPTYLALDSAGNLYVSDAGALGGASCGSCSGGGGGTPPAPNYRVRRIDALTGIISTVAGTGTTSFNGDGIPATNANLVPGQLAFDSSGNLIFTDAANFRVRMIDASTGLIWTIAGIGFAPGCCFIGDGGPATNAYLSLPIGLVLSPSGPLFVSEYGGNRVRRVALPSPFASTATTLSASTASVQTSDPVTFTAVLSAINGLAVNSTRGFQFVDLRSFTLLGEAFAVNGSASITRSFSGTGTHNIVATYVGDSAFGASTSPSLTISVTAPHSSVALVSNSNPSIDGQPFTLTATVTPTAATGTVTFFNGTTQLATQTVSNGAAISPQISLSAGTYSLSAQYGGDINHPASTSATITQTVNMASSSVALTSSANPATSGQSVTLTATVSPSTATGSITFLDGGAAMGTSTVSSGVATFSTSGLTPGTHSIIAAYSGDSHVFGFASPAIAQVIKATSSLTLTASANPSTPGQTVTFTAAVTPLTSTGSVQFLDGGVVIGTTTVNSGLAPFSTSALTQGTHSITAVYGGDSNNFGSTSPAIAEVIKATSSLTLTASDNPSTVGQTVTFAVALTPSTATGTVQFLDGGTVIGTSTVSSGASTFSTSALAQGTHSITAAYAGDSNTAASTSPPVAEVVKAISSLTLTASPNPSTLGQTVTFIVAVTPSTATGSVQFLDGTAAIGTSTISSGAATFSTSALTQGTHSITAVYGGDSNTVGSNSPAVAEVIKASSSLTLTSSANPSTLGQAVTFTAAVTPATATGSVQFLDGGVVIGTGGVSAGTATFLTSALTQGTHSITAVYGGDSNTVGSTSPAVAEVIKATSSLTLTGNVNPSMIGQTVTFTAAITPSTATGSVQFLDGSVVIGTSTVNSGAATFSTSALTQGTHSITASYGGDSSFVAATSSAISQLVVNVTSVVLVSSVNPSTIGQAVTFTVNLNPAATGSVQFLDGAVTIGTSSVASGGATFSTSALAVGTHTITAAYGGDSNYASASSSPLTQTVVKATSTVALASTQNPSPVGQPVTFIANVTPSTATGSVQFLDGAAVIGTATITPGSGAQFSTSALTQGAHSITAAYGGDATFAPATSAVVSQDVKLIGGLAFTASPNPSTVGQAVTFTVSMNPAATGSVQYFDGATLIGTASVVSGVATFSTSTLALGAHAISVTYGGDANYLGVGSAPINEVVNAKQTPTIALASTQNPSPVGQPVTFIANVTPSAAIGSVQFLDGATVIGTATITPGSGAQFSTSALTQGTHSITAVYGGDATFAPATSAAVSQSVKLIGGLAFTASPNPSTVGQAVTFTVSMNPAATGSVQYFDGATLIGTASVVSGVATLPTATLALGTHAISVTYGGDANYLGVGSAPINEVVNAKQTPTIALASTQNPSPVGQPITFIATITPSTATGSVQFLDGANVTGTVTITPGLGAQFSTSALTQGTHSITAVYGGDATFAPATSAAVSQAVKLIGGLAFTASPNPSTVGQIVTFTASMNPAATGSVQYFDGAALIGTASVVSGVATFSTSAFALGTHAISVVYSGDANYLGAGSAPLNQIVNPKQTPAVALASSANPATFGQSVTFTVSITPSTATGSVQFLDGGSVIRTASVASGVATFSTSALARGTHSISAVYGGDSFFLGTASGAIAQSVKGIAGLTLASSVNPSTAGQTVTFTATVNPAATGSVQYFDGTTLIGTASVASGVATFSTSALAVGTHSISVVYSGDANFFSASSAPLTQTVVKATSSIALTSSLNPSIAGQAVVITVTVTPASATGTVQIFDGGASLGTATLSNGRGSFTTSALAAGVHSIKAVYGGDAATTGSTSSIVTQTVKIATTTTLTSSENPEYHTNTIVFSAKVAPKAATGSVQFFDGTTLLGTATLNNGSASLSKKLSAGTHPIQAVYGGDANHAGSSSAILTETVH